MDALGVKWLHACKKAVYGHVVKNRALKWPKSAMSLRPSPLKSKIALNARSADDLL
jgi:hypothetical protein